LKRRNYLDGLLVKNKRALSGGALLLTAGVLLAAFSAELHTAFENLFLFSEKDTFAFHALFIGLLIVGCLTSILPASILGVFAGAFFGIGEGFLISAGSFLVAALTAFSFSRYFFRAASRRLAGKVINLENLEENLHKFGWKYALLLRLTPIAPFGVMSYGLGLTPIKMWHYVLTTFGTFPFLLACVCLGHASGLLIGQHGEFDHRVLWILVLLFTGGAVLAAVSMWLLPRLLGRIARGTHQIISLRKSGAPKIASSRILR
jgi:uncharacterized membrane protein YdjX (TVP38/TMEM64 family)